MKKLKLIIASIIFIGMLLIANNAYAASASISAPDSAEVGTPVTISVSGSGVQWYLELQVNGVTIASDSELENIDGNKTISFSGTYTPTTADSVTVTLSGSVTDADDGSTETSFGSKTISVEAASTPEEPDPTPEDDPNKSSNVPSESQSDDDGSEERFEEVNVTPKSPNNHLSSLTVSVGTLTPEFHRDNQDYTLEFPKDFDFKTLTSITVASTLEDETASKEGDGTYDVKEGENSISIRVTAESGNYRTYVIKFTKAAEVKASDLKLSSLVINMKDTAGKMTAATLMPNFKPDVFEYSMKVSKDIESLSITPTTDLEDVEIKVDGGKNLIPGKNVVTITLTSKKDNKVISKYVINVEKEKEEAAATNSEEENKGGWSIKEWLLLIAGIAFVALIVVLVVLFIIMRRNKLEGEDEFNEDSEEDETKIEAEISEHIRNFDKPEVEEEINIDSAEEKEVEPKLDFVEEEKETEEPKQEIDFSKDPDELPVEEVKEEKVVEEKKELPLIETTLDDIRETERKLDEEDPRGRYRGKRFE